MSLKQTIGWAMLGLFVLIAISILAYLVAQTLTSWTELLIPLGIVGYVILMIYFITDY